MNFIQQFDGTLDKPDSIQTSNITTFSPNLLIQDHIENSNSTSLVLVTESEIEHEIINDDGTNDLNLSSQIFICENDTTENSNEKEYSTSNCSTLEKKQFSKEQSTNCFYNSLLCHKCSKTFNYQKNLIKHQATCNGKTSTSGIKCPQCSHLFTRNDSLQEHVEKDHGLQLEKESIYFLNYNGFMVWKAEMEIFNSCLYVLQSKATLQKKPHKKRHYFKCHRSGVFISRSTGARKIKSEGSNKIDSTCTSTMVVTEDTSTGLVSVDFCKTHFGHGPNVIPSSSKKSKAAKTLQPETVDEDMNKINDEVNSFTSFSAEEDFSIIQHGFDMIEYSLPNETINVTEETSIEIPFNSKINLINGKTLDNSKKSRNAILVSKVKTIEQYLQSNEYPEEELYQIDKILNSVLKTLTEKRNVE